MAVPDFEATNITLPRETHTLAVRTTTVWNNETQEFEEATFQVALPLHGGVGVGRPWSYSESYRGVEAIDNMLNIGGKYYAFQDNEAADELLRRQGK